MFVHGARPVVLLAKREGSYLGQWRKGLEGSAARNVVIVATANTLARISWACCRAEKIIARYLLLQLPARRSDFEVRFSEVCRRTGRTKTQSNGVPENLR